jgi:hypothetical protein
MKLLWRKCRATAIVLGTMWPRPFVNRKHSRFRLGFQARMGRPMLAQPGRAGNRFDPFLPSSEGAFETSNAPSELTQGIQSPALPGWANIAWPVGPKTKTSGAKLRAERDWRDGVLFLPTFIDSGVSGWDSDVLFGFNLCAGIGQRA